MYHFIGIGGIGMSSLAKILLLKKKEVKGSDAHQSSILETLQKKGAKIFLGHKKENVQEGDVVIYSSAISHENEELLFAKEKKLKIMHRSDLLNEMIQGHVSLAICGTHGKTTTTSLLTEVLIDANLKPSYSIGGILNTTLTNADVGEGKHFVFEADESDGSFLKYFPSYAILTNVEEDHLDHWNSLENLKKGFSQFASQVKENFFWCNEDRVLKEMNLKGVSYGFTSDAMIYASNVKEKGFSSTFDVNYQKKVYRDVTINLAGKHNVLNALAVFGLALSLNVKEESIRYSLASFKGVKRRMEKIGECSKTLFLDDYAHHPSEIKAVLSALRSSVKEKRIVAVFQPHRLTRTRDLFDEFAKSFELADVAFITDIYSANENPIENIHSKNLVKKVKNTKCFYIAKEDFLKVKNFIHPHDVVVFLGAGDITKLSRDVFNAYHKKPYKFKVGLIFGGKSLEHEQSVLSAKNICKNLDKSIYDVQLFGINKEGKWQICNHNFHFSKDHKDFFSLEIFKKLKECDICLPIVHGPYGEDGMVQGFLDILNIAYTGPSYATYVSGVDKAWVKYIALYNGINVVKFIDIPKTLWQEKKKEFLAKIEELQCPFFIKAVHGGIGGIEQVREKKDVDLVIEKLFSIDDHLIVEEGILGQKVHLSLIKEDKEVKANVKLIKEDGRKKQEIFPEKLEEIKKVAVKLYKLLGCSDLVEMQFLIDDGKYYFDEMSPIPEFTNECFYHDMWEKSEIKIDFSDLLDRLIVLALSHRRKKEHKVE
jgi:UDP-N-acetylmuramate--alanine ligase